MLITALENVYWEESWRVGQFCQPLKIFVKRFGIIHGSKESWKDWVMGLH